MTPVWRSRVIVGDDGRCSVVSDIVDQSHELEISGSVQFAMLHEDALSDDDRKELLDMLAITNLGSSE